MTDFFRPGDHILLRETWRGRVWTARPVIVVEDSPQAICLFIAKGSTWKRPFDATGMPKRIPSGDWMLESEFWIIDSLRISVPGERFSILPFRHQQGDLRFWYLNIETPLTRTPFGFEYMDQTLDIVVSTDFTEWRWKDEEELAQAVALGLYTADEADDIRSSGERSLAAFLARKPPFDRDWEAWSAPPHWDVPVLPTDWDIIE